MSPRSRGAAIVAAALALFAACGARSPSALDTDNDHDGFTVQAGDCDDTNAAVHPGGDVLFTVDFAFAGTPACSARNPQQQVYRVTNNSCTAVSLQTLQVSLSLGGSCSGGQTYTVPLETAQVAPGATAVVRHGASAGTRTVTQSYGISDPSGRDCPLCGTIDTDETRREAAPMSDGHACLGPVLPY